jgi:methylated-DNA-[protein]-cysteine S-methyltransferase
MNTYALIETPMGKMTLTSADGRLTGALFGDETSSLGADWILSADEAVLTETAIQFNEYFEGHRLDFDLPLGAPGTAFQQRVWGELCRIPFGTTLSYGELAARVGNRNASRAVGLANGQNPIAIIVPCHRVIGANGKLVGYAGGLNRKIALLDFETAVRATGPQTFSVISP